MFVMNINVTEPVLSEVARAIDLGGGPSVVARALNVSTQTVCFYRDGKRRIKAEHGALLESLCGRQVTRKEIWPVSWPRIWPELAGGHTPDAPQTPAGAEQGVANA